MAKRCRTILTGAEVCSIPDQFMESNLGIGLYIPLFPTSVLGLTLWHDDLAIPSNRIEVANRVSQWNDLSANAFHTTQSTGIDQLLRSGSALIANGSNEFMNYASGLRTELLTQSQGEVFAIVKVLAADRGQIMTLSDTTQADRYAFLTKAEDGGFNDSIMCQFRLNADHDTLVGDAGSADAQIHILNYSSNGSRYRLNIDNVEQTVNVDNGDDSGDWFDKITSANVLHMCRFKISALDIFYNMEIYSVVIYDNELSSENRAGILNFLNNRITSISPIF